MERREVKIRRNRARELDEAGRPAAALVAVRKILAADPEDESALVLQASLLGFFARYAEAETALEQARRLFAEGYEHAVHVELGHLYEKWGRLELAFGQYRKVTELRPDHAAGHVRAGATLVRLGRFAEAEAYFQRGISCQEGHVEEAHYHLGLLYRGQERFAEARPCFERALQLEPSYEEARGCLADVIEALQLESS